MNKRYLPAIASILILAVAAASFMPVFAANALRATSMPTLRVVSIAEDDEWRETGIIVLGMTNPLWPLTGFKVVPDLLAQYKVLVSYNGLPVKPASFSCQVIEKDKANPLKDKQFYAENLKTVPKESPWFECKWRDGKPGVGVVDLYYIGPKTGQYIADYAVIFSASYVIGRTTIWGVEVQDVCVLGWPAALLNEIPIPLVGYYIVTKPDGTEHWVYPDAIGLWASCEDITLFQKHEVLEIPFTWT